MPALGQRGFVVPTGSEGGVGLGGVIPGGGFGLLTRSLGLACDNLISAEIVVADGACSAKVVEASEHVNSDLLWACRGGGGGNFGIATSYTLKLHELSNVQFLIAKWTGHDELGDLLRTWQRDAPVADERLTSALEVNSDVGRVDRCVARRLAPDAGGRTRLAARDRHARGDIHGGRLAGAVRQRRQRSRPSLLEVLLAVRNSSVSR